MCGQSVILIVVRSGSTGVRRTVVLRISDRIQGIRTDVKGQFGYWEHRILQALSGYYTRLLGLYAVFLRAQAQSLRAVVRSCECDDCRLHGCDSGLAGEEVASAESSAFLGSDDNGYVKRIFGRIFYLTQAWAVSRIAVCRHFVTAACFVPSRTE